MRVFRFMIGAVVGATLVFSAVGAQQKAPLSPPGTAEVVVSGKKISVSYSRPYMKGRKIFGDLVPYDQVWRTGANKSTDFKTEVDLMFGKTLVPAGSYTLYSLPSATGWKLIVNKQTGQWGTEYDQSKDLARIDLKVARTTATVEQFTITLNGAKSGGVLKLEWENTSGSVAFTVK